MWHRPLQRSDVAECLTPLPPWLALNDARRAALPGLWQRLADLSEETRPWVP